MKLLCAVMIGFAAWWIVRPGKLERACPTEHRSNGTKIVADAMADDGACHYVVRQEWW